MKNEIDFIITWVDGNDTNWQHEKEKYSDSKTNSADKSAFRYRDWGILKYWFRSIEENAPWVHKIYFVTCGQVPDFLKTDHPKLKMVCHNDYIPQEYLPTFSSHTIENFMNRIPGLTNQVVYFNDDTFLNARTEKTDFFKDGLPCYTLGTRLNRIPHEWQGAFYFARYNSALAVSKHFTKSDFLREHKKNFLNKNNGIFYNALNLALLPQKNMYSFCDQHVASPILKSTMDEVWEKEHELLEATGQHRFRYKTDVSHFIFRYWDIMRGNYIPHCPTNHYYALNNRNIEAVAFDIIHGKHQSICLNDSDLCPDFEKFRQIIQNAFETRYPNKSSFEK